MTIMLLSECPVCVWGLGPYFDKASVSQLAHVYIDRGAVKVTPPGWPVTVPFLWVYINVTVANYI